MTYQVAIPTFRRPEGLARMTLRTLHDGGVRLASQVTVWLSDPGEQADYERAIEAEGLPIPVFRPGQPGLVPNRVAIHRAYPEGTFLVQMDDDVRKLVAKAGDKTADVAASAVIGAMQTAVERTRLGLVGIYPVPNGFFMRHEITTDLRLVVGSMWACRNTHDPSLIDLEFGDDKEDHERTIRWYEAEGGVARLSNVAPVTRFYKEPGGLQETRTAERVQQAVDAMCARWPHFVRPKASRKGTQMPEMELKLRPL